MLWVKSSKLRKKSIYAPYLWTAPPSHLRIISYVSRFKRCIKPVKYSLTFLQFAVKRNPPSDIFVYVCLVCTVKLWSLACMHVLFFLLCKLSRIVHVRLCSPSGLDRVFLNKWEDAYLSSLLSRRSFTAFCIFFLNLTSFDWLAKLWS